MKSDWFAHASRAFRSAYPSAPDCFVCPLCLRAFLPHFLDQDVITIEHVPPRAVGGRRLVLTCRDCNSLAGHNLDSHAAAFDQIVRFAHGTMTQASRVEMRIGSNTVHGDIIADGKDIKVQVLDEPRGNRKGTADALTTYFDNMIESGSWSDDEITVTIKNGYDGKSAKVSWLRSAYLAAFAVYGYSYILHPEMDIVRQQIQRPADDLINVFHMTDPDASADTREIIEISAPEWIRSIVVKMGQWIVFLPVPDAAPGLYSRIRLDYEASRGSAPTTFKIKGTRLGWPEAPQYLADFLRGA